MGSLLITINRPTNSTLNTNTPSWPSLTSALATYAPRAFRPRSLYLCRFEFPSCVPPNSHVIMFFLRPGFIGFLLDKGLATKKQLLDAQQRLDLAALAPNRATALSPAPAPAATATATATASTNPESRRSRRRKRNLAIATNSTNSASVSMRDEARPGVWAAARARCRCAARRGGAQSRSRGASSSSGARADLFESSDHPAQAWRGAARRCPACVAWREGEACALGSTQARGFCQWHEL